MIEVLWLSEPSAFSLYHMRTESDIILNPPPLKRFHFLLKEKLFLLLALVRLDKLKLLQICWIKQGDAMQLER